MNAPHVLILNDWPTPYRLPLFERLGRRVGKLTVLFSTGEIRDYGWEAPRELPFEFEILPRLELRLRRPPHDEPRIVLINPTLLARLVRHRPDVVVTYAFSIATWTAMVYARLRRIPLVSWSNDTLHTGRHFGPLQRLSRRRVIRHAAACVTAGAEGRDHYLSLGARPERLFTVLQAPDVEWFARQAERIRGEDTAAGRAASPPPIVLYVGRLNELKGAHLLLEAFAAVRRRVTDAILLFAGDGPLRARLELRARRTGLAGAVRFAGFVQQEDLPALYARAAVLAFPTLGDNFGVVLGEAAASGLPLVASQFAGGTPEYVRPAENGWIVDPRDARALSDRISDVLSDRAARRAMGEASRRIALARTPERSAADFERAIRAARGLPLDAPEPTNRRA